MRRNTCAKVGLEPTIPSAYMNKPLNLVFVSFMFLLTACSLQPARAQQTITPAPTVAVTVKEVPARILSIANTGDMHINAFRHDLAS